MKEHFYSHLIDLSSFLASLDELVLSEVEKLHLHSLVRTNMHYIIMDMILSELSPADKKLFLSKVHTEEHDEIWQLLHAKVEKVEEKIQKAAEITAAELHKDIKEMRASN